MFKYYEIYEINCFRYFDENDLQDLANEYKEYLEDDVIDDVDMFNDFMIYKFYFDIPYDSDFIDSNVEQLYEEIKKYM